MNHTESQYKIIWKKCQEIFEKKLHDYGTSWEVMRVSSLTDQIFIKAKRIRNIEDQEFQKIEDSIASEWIGIVNYSIIALIVLAKGKQEVSLQQQISIENAVQQYLVFFTTAFELMKNKNQDYGEVWREMRLSSITDLVLSKIFRIKQIEDLKDKTLISESKESIYLDMINYGVFSLIRLEEQALNH